MARIATGNWDAVIVTHSGFERIPVSRQTQEEFIKGELRELEGYWCHGRGDVPDFLFDPQFALSQTDWSLCKGLGKGTTTSKYQAEADIAWSMSQKQKGKSKEGKGDGGKAQQLQGKSKEGKGDGGKAQQLLAVGSQRSKDLYDEQHLVFQSNVLKLNGDGTWQYRAGTAISLPQLLLSLGPSYTAAQLYAYFNTSKTLATKRPHAWSSPWREAAKYKRYQETGRYGLAGSHASRWRPLGFPANFSRNCNVSADRSRACQVGWKCAIAWRQHHVAAAEEMTT